MPEGQKDLFQQVTLDSVSKGEEAGCPGDAVALGISTFPHSAPKSRYLPGARHTHHLTPTACLHDTLR